MTKRTKSKTALAALTPRERAVLSGIVGGKTNAEIGTDLGVSYETVKSYINRLRTKLGRRTKTDLAVFAAQHNIEAA